MRECLPSQLDGVIDNVSIIDLHCEKVHGTLEFASAFQLLGKCAAKYYRTLMCKGNVQALLDPAGKTWHVIIKSWPNGAERKNVWVMEKTGACSQM